MNPGLVEVGGLSSAWDLFGLGVRAAGVGTEYAPTLRRI